jgi:hypothetical protein
VVSAVPLPPKLTGTIIGTTGSWNNDPNSTRAAVFDGNLNTFFDALEANGAWAGLDLGAGASKLIGAIRYAPRAAWASGRMTGGKFQGANNADFSDAVTLHTVVGAPPANVLTTQLVSHPNGFRYVRYLSPDNGFCNVAEVEFYGSDALPAPPAAPTGLVATAGNMQVTMAWNAVAGATSYNVKRATTDGGPYTVLGSVTGTTATDTTAANNTTYYYVVSAVNAAGEGGNSNQASATPVSPPIAEAEMQAPHDHDQRHRNQPLRWHLRDWTHLPASKVRDTGSRLLGKRRFPHPWHRRPPRPHRSRPTALHPRLLLSHPYPAVKGWKGNAGL